jgi:hypothetical protein
VTRETRRTALLGAVFWPDRVDALLNGLSAEDARDGKALVRDLADADPAARLAALAEAFWPADPAGEGDRLAHLAARIGSERPRVAAALQALLLPPEACAALPQSRASMESMEWRESSGPVSPVLARLASEWSWEVRS